MERETYDPLPQSRLRSDAGYYLPDAMLPARVRAQSPALDVMTDLRRLPAAAIGGDTTIEEANHAMILRGVRLLLVTESEGRVIGLITAHDIHGERPLQVGRDRSVRFSEILVRDVMVPYYEVDAIQMADMLHAQVGHVVATLRKGGRQHALVVDQDASGRQMIRGIVSATQIARQLGIPMPTTEVARTFAEIEAALTR